MKDFVQLGPGEIREFLSHGAFVTVDCEERDAYLHAPEVTAPVPADFVEDLVRNGFIRRVNEHDPIGQVAIYRHQEAV